MPESENTRGLFSARVTRASHYSNSHPEDLSAYHSGYSNVQINHENLDAVGKINYIDYTFHLGFKPLISRLRAGLAPSQKDILFFLEVKLYCE